MTSSTDYNPASAWISYHRDIDTWYKYFNSFGADCSTKVGVNMITCQMLADWKIPWPSNAAENNTFLEHYSSIFDSAYFQAFFLVSISISVGLLYLVAFLTFRVLNHTGWPGFDYNKDPYNLNTYPYNWDS